eukprot:TRINITY_DN7126_c0_g1_i4.p1 TRINITY_DN7126_c0_g1~~TRINITY_DN7126_c0_g1_i4.p1  ORF type:complete len:334 (+),score=76.80 TRINITY_DN7126_c0_g1_i4:130-1131(+)
MISGTALIVFIGSLLALASGIPVLAGHDPALKAPPKPSSPLDPLKSAGQRVMRSEHVHLAVSASGDVLPSPRSRKSQKKSKRFALLPDKQSHKQDQHPLQETNGEFKVPQQLSRQPPGSLKTASASFTVTDPLNASATPLTSATAAPVSASSSPVLSPPAASAAAASTPPAPGSGTPEPAHRIQKSSLIIAISLSAILGLVVTFRQARLLFKPRDDEKDISIDVLDFPSGFQVGFEASSGSSGPPSETMESSGSVSRRSRPAGVEERSGSAGVEEQSRSRGSRPEGVEEQRLEKSDAGETSGAGAAQSIHAADDAAGGGSSGAVAKVKSAPSE